MIGKLILLALLTALVVAIAINLRNRRK